MKKLLTSIVLLITISSLSGCATAPISTPSDFKPRPVDVRQSPLRVTNFVVILDASQSMTETLKEENKFDAAKELVSRLIQTLPQEDMASGLRTFGHGFYDTGEHSQLRYGISRFSPSDFQAALDEVTHAGGNSPLAGAIAASGNDLRASSGQTAIIAFSDGKQMVGSPAEAVAGLKDRYGERLCMYAVVMGDDPEGVEAMAAAARAGACGFTISGERIYNAEAMADFVTRVFLDATGGFDADGDGVTDDADKCPETPEGLEVDDKGCPPDSDADGVGDFMDKCPGTPAGATVNTVGCWILADIRFALDEWRIDPQHVEDLNSVARIMAENPKMAIEIEGHTDNTGPAENNRILSRKRAESVKTHLIRMGVSERRMTSRGYGASRPIATNDTAHGRQQNRRVEIRPSR